MPFEHYKTQVLLLHSEQSALDVFSAGFNEKYSVHCATSGTEALNTLGDTPIHVIVSAQDLPGMSGIDALREAKKRSPDTVGILLAGSDEEDGLEALVGDMEVFQIVRGSITPDALISLVESATQRMRLMALAESANDHAANVDEPATEHIVMETLENGSAIISDGTSRMPALQPHKIEIAPDAGGRNVDVLLMTKDEEFLTTIKDSARGLHNVHHAVTPTQAENFVRDKTIGVLVTDAAMVGSDVEGLTHKLRKERPRMVAIVAGRRDDGEMLMELINRGQVYRFLLKPVSPGRARLAIEASVKHHLEAPDSAFKSKPQSASPLPKRKAKSKISKPKATPKTKPIKRKKPEPVDIPVLEPEIKPIPVLESEIKPIPASQSKARKDEAAAKKKAEAEAKKKKEAEARAKKEAEAKAKKEADARAKKEAEARAKKEAEARKKQEAEAKKREKSRRIEPTISAVSIDEVLDEAFGTETNFKDTLSGLAGSVGSTLSNAGALAGSAQEAVQASTKVVAGAVGGAIAPLRKPKTIGIAGGAIAVLAVIAWVISNWDSIPTDILPEQADAVPAVADTDVTLTRPIRETRVEAQAAATVRAYQPLLDEARAARNAGNLIEPAGDNAVELYLTTLAEAPGDPIVSAELDNVISRVLGLAETAILRQSAEDADNALAMVRLADPDNPRLTFLDAQLRQLQLRTTVDEVRIAIRDGDFEDAGRLISEARSVAGNESTEVNLLSQELSAARMQQQVDEVLTMANERLEAGDLLSPANDNARYYYELALSDDPGNQAAQQGLTIIASKLVLQAREAIDAGRLDDAAVLLRDARPLDPSSDELAASAKALDGAFAAIAASERQAEAARLAELERKAELQREAERQAEAARLAELERQAEIERRAEAVRQEELRRQAKLEEQAEIERLVELDRQADAARQAEIKRKAEEERQAIAREAQQQAAEKRAAAAAVSSVLGVAGSTIRVPASRSAETSSNSQSVQRSAPAPRPVTVAASGSTTANASGGSSNSNTGQTPVAANAPQTVSTGNNAVGSSGSNSNTGAATNTVVPISSLTRTNYIAPQYPRMAQRRSITGSVDVQFTVSTIGTVTDISVLRAEPGETFNKAAMDAVAQWRFEPVIENGVAVEKRSAVRMAFDLE